MSALLTVLSSRLSAYLIFHVRSTCAVSFLVSIALQGTYVREQSKAITIWPTAVLISARILRRAIDGAATAGSYTLLMAAQLGDLAATRPRA
jgi:hypothetical protein